MSNTITAVMTQDTIVKGKDNAVLLLFTFAVAEDPSLNLQSFTELTVIFGAETYTLTGDPTIVQVNSTVELQLNLGTTTEAFSQYLEITGTSVTYPNGYLLISKCHGNSVIPTMC